MNERYSQFLGGKGGEIQFVTVDALFFTKTETHKMTSTL